MRGGNNNMQRIQCKRIKGFRLPPRSFRCDRSSKFGNPYVAERLPDRHVFPPLWRVRIFRSPYKYGLYSIESDAVHAACEYYREWLENTDEGRKYLRLAHERLSGMDNLACWCALDEECHVDILIECLCRPSLYGLLAGAKGNHEYI